MSFFFAIRDKFSDPLKKIENTKIKSGDYVLDYGCGPGSFTIAATEVVGPSGKVYAADIHPLAAKKVKKKALKKGLNYIETISTNCKTGLENNSMDVIICFDTIHDLSNPENNLREFHRVLKSDGFLSVDDHHLEENELLTLITDQGLFKLSNKEETVYNFIKIEK